MAELGRTRPSRPRVFGLRSFMEPGCAKIDVGGAFRDNVRSFLSDFAAEETVTGDGMATWVTFLADEKSGRRLPLYTVEEQVRNLPNPFCDYCRCTGWSDHFVSKRKYHLIIPVENEWDGQLLADGGFLDSQTHLLHGLIHCNGYGHLLSINGYHCGSKPLRGQDLLDLFDRICTTLRVKEVTVEDTAKKQRMDLRLLHAVAYGQTWFGRWGYKLRHRSFGITTNRYQQAIEVLSSIKLDKLVQDLAKVSRDRAMKRLVANYQKSSPANTARHVTLGDLLRRMLDLKATLPFDIPRPSPAAPAAPAPAAPAVGRAKKFAEVAAKLDSRWSVPRMELAAEVVVEALREAREQGRRGMTRQDVRDAARLQIGDTGLLDFVLKSLGGCVVGAHLVRRTVNPTTRVLEFSIQDLGAAARPSTDPSLMPPSTPALEEPAPRDQVGISRREEAERDVWYVYRQVFHEYPGDETVGVAVQVIRDCKHFSKTWPFVDILNDDNLRFFCGVIADAPDMEVLTRGVPACELVVLPPYATVGDLKRAGEAALRDTYLVMDRFTARSVDGVPSLAASGLMEWEYKLEEQEGEPLFGMVESGETVWLRGSGFDKVTELRYEGGADGWTVDCKCGATDDDGERMVACDVCEVWQHTRCAGYSDADSPPKAFWCEPCSMVLDPRRFSSCSSSSSPATCAAASRFLVAHDAASHLPPSALHF